MAFMMPSATYVQPSEECQLRRASYGCSVTITIPDRLYTKLRLQVYTAYYYTDGISQQIWLI